MADIEKDPSTSNKKLRTEHFGHRYERSVRTLGLGAPGLTTRNKGIAITGDPGLFEKSPVKPVTVTNALAPVAWHHRKPTRATKHGATKHETCG